MPLGIYNVEYLDLNSQRSFPLADDASKLDASGAFTLPDSFLVELYLPCSFALSVDSSKFFLSSVTVYPIGYAISVGYDDGSGSPPTVATATFAAASHVENTAYALTGVGPFSDATGKVVIGVLADINLQPPGQWSFTYAGGKLDPDCIRPQIRGVSSISVVSGGVTSSPIYGDIQLVAGSNIQLLVSGSEIRINAVEGAGLTETCACTGTTTPAIPIRTINGIPPSNTGGFLLTGSACIDITATAGGMTIIDTCSQPCCGCAELEALTAELAHLQDEVTTMINFLSRQQAAIDAMNNTVLASRLGDAPCTSS